MSYRIAAIDIHKRVLMVVIATVADQVKDATGEAIEFECRRFGAGTLERKHLVSWLQEGGVLEVVMESTAQYWNPVCIDLEPHFAKLHLAQAHSNRAPKGRKNDFRDAKRLARRLLADELMLSFVPEPEQRIWRTMTRGKHQLIRDGCGYRINWNLYWRKHGSNCPAWLAIYWESVDGGFWRRCPRERRIRPN